MELQSRLLDTVKEFVTSGNDPVFAIGLNQIKSPVLTINVGGKSKAALGAMLSAKLKEEGLPGQVRVAKHSERMLASAKSLEAISSRFSHDWVMYDPTGIVRRSKALVGSARKTRENFGDAISGLFWIAGKRCVYAVINRERIANSGTSELLVYLRDVEAFMRMEITSRMKAFGVSGEFQVKTSFTPPQSDLTPIDETTFRAYRKVFTLPKGLRKKAMPLAVLAGLGLAAPAFAGPAVSGINGKIEALGGEFDGDGGYAGAGSVTFPIGNLFGLQLDATGGEIDSEGLWGGGAHFFMRNPELGLVGLTASYTEYDDIDMERYGAEAELYLGSFTIAGHGGYQGGDVDDGMYGGGDLRFYATDNFMIQAGARHADDFTAGRVGIEFQPAIQALPGLSFFADGWIGEDNYDAAYAGIRYYFGAEKSLIKRHREDDPANNLINDVAGFYKPIYDLNQSETIITTSGSSVSPPPTI